MEPSSTSPIPDAIPTAIDKPMHFLMAAVGSRGDLMPILYSALKLKEAGHQVSILANPFFAQDVEKCGLNLVPVGTANEWIDHIADKRFWKQSTSFPATIDLVDRSFYQFQKAIEGCGEYDAVIQSPLAIGAGMVAERDGKPAITVHPSAYTFWMRKDVPVLDQGMGWLKKLSKAAPTVVRNGVFWAIRKGLNKMYGALEKPNAFRKALGLPPVKDFYNDVWVRPNGIHAGLFPDWYASKQADWPSAFQTFDFPMEGIPQQPLANEISEFVAAGEKPLVWTFGGDVDAQKFVGEAIKASAALGKRAIIISPNKKGLEAAEGNKNILYAQHAPYEKLLQHCEAFIHHGGVGTIAHAVAAGIPQVIMPRIGDQHDNAYIAQQLGVAEVISPKQATSSGYVTALKSVLGSQDKQRSVALLQHTMQQHTAKVDFARWAEMQIKAAKNGSRLEVN